jgi:hypothetical protein
VCPIAISIPPPRDWEAIARDYAACVLSVSDICALHAVSRSALYDHARRNERWLYRVTLAGGPPRPTREQDLGQRLFNALDRKLSEFERRHAAATADGTVPSAADAERDARTLNTLVRLFDKLQGYAKKAACRPAPPASAAAAASAEPVPQGTDALRSTLARRLETLRLGAETEGPSPARPASGAPPAG